MLSPFCVNGREIAFEAVNFYAAIKLIAFHTRRSALTIKPFSVGNVAISRAAALCGWQPFVNVASLTIASITSKCYADAV